MEKQIGMAVVLGDFLGAWHLDRTIAHGDGTRATYTGEAVWQAEGTGALYIESGWLEIAGQGRFQAERRYRWASDLSVHFGDGRFFHQVPMQGGAAGHWCDPDQYDVEYDFAAWPSWQAVWQVRGPRKDYKMISRYTRP